MKDGKIFLFIFAVIIACFTIYSVINMESEGERQDRITLERIDLQNRIVHTEIRREQTTALYSQFSGIAVPMLIFLVISLTGLFIWRAYDLRQESWSRPVDGMFALQSLGGWKVDPAKQVTGIVGYDSSTKQLACDFQTIGVDRQLDYAKTIERTRTTIASTANSGIKFSAQAKLAAGYYDRSHTVPALPESAITTPVALLSVNDAFSQSTANQWIVGQSKDTGATYSINPKETTHFGIVGATGTGKTAYMANLIMAYVLRFKQRFIVLDGKGGADWSKYQDVVEYQPVDYTNIGAIVGQLETQRQHRQHKLNELGINSIWQADKPPKAVFVLFDEFGSVMDSLRLADKPQYKQVELMLGNLLRLSRSTGIYFIFCDQDPTKWPSSMAANLTDNLCFKLGGNKGSAVSEYNLSSLGQGEFQVGNERYFTYPTYQVIDGLLSDIQPKKPVALLTGCSETVVDDRGVVAEKPQNTPPKNETVVDGLGGFTQRNETVSTVGPLLTGPATTQKNRDVVMQIYHETGSKTATCKRVWGRKDGVTWKWLNAVIAEYGETK